MRLDKYQFALTPRVSQAVRHVYKGVCQYCMGPNARHVDHIIPKARGGEDNLANYILACDSCNLRKGSGAIAPQYLGLITAIADKNKERVFKAIPGERHTVIQVGLSKKLILFRIPISKPPTLFELGLLSAANKITADLMRKLSDAKSKDRETAAA